MNTTLGHTPVRRHPVLPDVGRPIMAKADARKLDVDWLAAIGAVIQHAVNETHWSNKEAAARVQVDDAEFGKWLSGSRRPQFDKLFAVPELRCPLVVAFARLAGEGIDITTTITLRRSA